MNILWYFRITRKTHENELCQRRVNPTPNCSGSTRRRLGYSRMFLWQSSIGSGGTPSSPSSLASCSPGSSSQFSGKYVCVRKVWRQKNHWENIVRWIIAFAHGDYEAENFEKIENGDFTPCILANKNFASAFLFSVETQHTIGYG